MFSEMSYHVWRFMAFRPNDQSYGHIHGIVCSNNLMLAQGCILEWQTMLPKEVFIFFGQKIHFPFFECPKWVFLWRTYQIFVAKWHHTIFRKYYTIFYVQLTKWLGVKTFDPPLVKNTNFHRFSRKRVKFELQLPHSLLMIFSKNHF